MNIDKTRIREYFVNKFQSEAVNWQFFNKDWSPFYDSFKSEKASNFPAFAEIEVKFSEDKFSAAPMGLG
jgi:hypothetical protein